MSCKVATGNRNKITFCLSTRVALDDSFLNHQYGLSLSMTDEINKPRLDSTRLVGKGFALGLSLFFLIFVICDSVYHFFFIVSKDFIGLLTALHYECVSDDVEGFIIVAKFELTDERYPFCHIYFVSRWHWFFVLPFFLVYIFHGVGEGWNVS